MSTSSSSSSSYTVVPLFQRTPDIFLFPQVPLISIATVLISTLIVINVVTEIVDYHQSIRSSSSAYYYLTTKNNNSYFNNNKKKQKRACNAVNIAALQVTLTALILIYISSHVVASYTIHAGIDGRMIYVLEGLSRLEASILTAYISTKIPIWIGVYHSSSGGRVIGGVGKFGIAGSGGGGNTAAAAAAVASRKQGKKPDGTFSSSNNEDNEDDGFRILKFHVRYTIAQYFLLVWCLCLPFSGHFVSMMVGFILGVAIESVILFARRGGGGDDDDTTSGNKDDDDSSSLPERKFSIATIASLIFAFCASVMFADGCHYIQVVWGSGLYFSEWGLGIATFSSCAAAILCVHFYYLQRTIRKYYVDKRISTHEKMEKGAIALMKSHLFKKVSSTMSETQRIKLLEEIAELDDSERSASSTNDDDDTTSAKPATSTTTWSLLKMRLFAPTDLVVLSRLEYYLGVFVSLASLFVVIVNIGATHQMNIVRKNFHRVHDSLYGEINEGPVCAWEKLGGRIDTFASKEKALEEGYTVAHCGACGECSSWHDLRLQYTTRTYLAKEAFRCAKMALVYGENATHKCLQEEPIGFSEKCAMCWTKDILCTRANCAFIFLQSNMINTFSNFQVNPDTTITSATCEEAMCELDFVPCSGANRRRMNITSTIVRPGDQRCGIVDVDWEEIFGEGGSMNDYGGVGGSNDEL